jgi:hypothetical protein
MMLRATHPRADARARIRPWRRVVQWAAGLVLAAFVLAVCRPSSAEGGVPLGLQALLVSRLVTFDRNFLARAGPVAKVLVLHRPGNADSVFEGASMARALAELEKIGGVPVRVEEGEFSDPDALAQRCRTAGFALVYLTVGLESDTRRIANALVGVDVLTVGTSARHAENGSVVGFAIEEARPKLVLNLKQAAAQNVKFKAEVLQLARIVE